MRGCPQCMPCTCLTLASLETRGPTRRSIPTHAALTSRPQLANQGHAHIDQARPACRRPGRRPPGGRLGPHPQGLEDVLVSRTQRRHVPGQPPDRRRCRHPRLRGHAENQHRCLGRGARPAHPVARRRPAVGNAGRFHQVVRCRAGGLPAAEKGPQCRVPAQHRPPAAAHQPLWRGVPHPQPHGLRHPPVFPGTRFRLRPHADHYRQRLRGCRRNVPRHQPAR